MCALLETVGTTTTCVALAAPLLQPAQPAQAADVIVILGRDGRERMNLGTQLYLQGYAPQVVLFNSSLHYLPDAAQLRPALIQINGPQDTWEEATTIAQLAQQQGWRRIMVITDPPHIRRTAWLFRKALGSTATCIPVATQPTWWHWPRWWTSQHAARYVRHELLSLPYHLLRVGL
jgi:uncharacterized SAM-binding protein YcdF (DUF218 family)